MAIAHMLFITATVVWLSEFVLFRSSKRKRGARKQAEPQVEKSSFIFILAAVIGCITMSLTFREMNWTYVDKTFLLWLGLSFYILGIFLRFWAMIKLRGQFTRDVHTSVSMRLVSDGPYSFMRHPLYTGLFLCVVGVALYTQTLAGILLSSTLMLVVLLLRIHLEERMLEAALQETYVNWKKQRWILLPWVY